MKKLFSLSIAILIIPFFPPCLFSANLLVDYDDQKEGDYSTQPNNEVQQPKQVCDYTILNYKNINHTLEDIEEVEEDLRDYVSAVNQRLVITNNESTPLLLGTVLQHQQTNKYHQYLITSTGLLSEATQLNAVKRAHRKGFHLIKATSEHVILQLLEWLQISGHYTVTALHTNRPVCRHCCLIAHSLWKKKLQTNEKGCLSTPFSMLDKVPNLARKYINTHLNLSLVQNLIVPMMGYVSKEEMKKAIQQKDEQIRMLSSELNTKDNKFNNKSQLIEALSNQLEEKDEQIQMFDKEINKKDHQLNEKKQEVNNYKIHLLKDIAAQLKRLRTEFKLRLDDIHIKNENSVKNFVTIASLQIKEGTKQLDEDMQTVHSWHAKYKGNDWKYFNYKNSDGVFWDDIYLTVQEKMDKISRNNDKILIFFSILKSLDTLLPTNKSYNQNSSKNKRYQLEMAQMRGKLQPSPSTAFSIAGWRWLK